MALAVNYLYQDTLALPNVVFTAAVVSVVLTDLISGRLAASVLVPANATVETTSPGTTIGAAVATVSADAR